MGLLSSEEKQKVLAICEDRCIRLKSVPICGTRLQQTKERKAWFRLMNYYRPVKGIRHRLLGGLMGNAQRILVINENDALPLSPYEEYSGEELNRLTNASNVVEEALEADVSKVDTENSKRFAFDVMSVSIAFLVFGVIFVAGLVAMGRINLSDIMRGFTGG